MGKQFYPPPLIRSNSYTLDGPSPMFLEHLKKASEAAEEIKPANIEVYQTDISLNYLTSDNELGVLQEENGYGCCHRKLFPPKNDSLKKEWAASVIAAHVKGFLTRRLLKPEKVQALVATVKDVLVCTVELHCSDYIDETDVELHRRLMNQLSATLYAFHIVFFKLSTQERMAVIAVDRQRRIEKLERSQSDRRSVLRTSHI
ncbi:unnamed protein product [Ceutorhynchus assimilis]|uniref:Uncharacterized protein n=1 Tax=Ceutorhynchus assimilis TaxID=467358 RepID=A0A9N9MBW3_9CUCU|nr:unnamed protein product [Ceutorhynchus assimilis]